MFNFPFYLCVLVTSLASILNCDYSALKFSILVHIVDAKFTIWIWKQIIHTCQTSCFSYTTLLSNTSKQHFLSNMFFLGTPCFLSKYLWNGLVPQIFCIASSILICCSCWTLFSVYIWEFPVLLPCWILVSSSCRVYLPSCG